MRRAFTRPISDSEIARAARAILEKPSKPQLPQSIQRFRARAIVSVVNPQQVQPRAKVALKS
jgi:hypothetical protein